MKANIICKIVKSASAAMAVEIHRLHQGKWVMTYHQDVDEVKNETQGDSGNGER